MGTEAIVCPTDGATEGFTQVEPGTYYCPHHKGLFRYVDPGRITVEHKPSFCSCGNLIEFQCQLCQKGLCGECDIIEWRKRHETERLIVSVRGFGYLEAVANAESLPYTDQIWSVAGNKITKARSSNSRMLGPFLQVEDIWPHLLVDLGNLRHICCTCLGTGVPATAEAIAAGRICENPGCGVAPDSHCQCCRNAFCKRHIESIATARGPIAGSLESFRLSAGMPQPTGRLIGKLTWGIGLQSSSSADYYGPSVVGLCGMCALERTRKGEEAIFAIGDSYPGITRDSYGGFYRVEKHSQESRPWDSFFPRAIGMRANAEAGRQKAVVEGFSEIVRQKIRELEKRPGPCVRERYFESSVDKLVREYRSDPMWIHMNKQVYWVSGYQSYIYRVLDEREKISPGPA